MNILRLILIVITCLIIHENSYAQFTAKPHIGIQAGVALPGEVFAEQYGRTGTSGGAEVGRSYGIFGAYYFSNWFGLGAKYGIHTFPSSTGDNGEKIGDYRLSSFLIGPTLVNKTFSDKFSIQIRILGGILRGHQPEVTLNDKTILQESRGTTFNFLAGMGFTYHAFDNISFSVILETEGGSPSIEAINSNGNTEKLKRDQNFSTINFGVNYEFGSKF